MNAPDRQALRPHPGALRAALRLHLVLVDLRRRGAREQRRQPAAAARGAADRPRRHPRLGRLGDRRRRTRSARARTAPSSATTRRGRCSATRSATASSSEAGWASSSPTTTSSSATRPSSSRSSTSSAADPQEGSDVQSSLDPDAQQTAIDALGGQNGSVVAIVPATGEVRTMVSVPTYDPNDVPDRFAAVQRERGRAALQPRDAGRLPAGIDDEGRDRDGCPRQRRVRLRLGPERRLAEGDLGGAARQLRRTRASATSTWRRR